MPKVHTLKANKDYPDIGVKKGERYFKWSKRTSRFGKGVICRSKTYPKRQQLTSSDFKISLYNIEDALVFADYNKDAAFSEQVDDAKSVIEQAVSDIETLRDETQEKFDNIPEGLQSGPTGELLQGRIDELDNWISELQGIDEPDASADDREEEYTNFVAAARDCQYNGE